MQNQYTDTLIKVACAILGFAALLIVAIHESRFALTDLDKFYPAILVVSIIFLHWLSWQVYFELIGLPRSVRKSVSSQKISARSGWRLSIAFGYFILILSIFNHYVSPEYAEAATGVNYTLALVSVGAIGQMAYVTRFLITQKYTEEGA